MNDNDKRYNNIIVTLLYIKACNTPSTSFSCSMFFLSQFFNSSLMWFGIDCTAQEKHPGSYNNVMLQVYYRWDLSVAMQP